MNNKTIISLFMLAALYVLVACSDNLFGSGSTEGGSGDIKSLRIDAENAFRNGNYKKAYNICSTIVAKDPTVSFGYYGMAKAALWEKGISNPAKIFNDLDIPDNEIPFIDLDSYDKTRYLQGMKMVANALSLLDRRDSLTRLYEFHKEDSLSWATTGRGLNKIVDGKSLEARLDTFRIYFCGGNSNGTGACFDTTAEYRKPFPLSDREFKGDYFGNVLFIATFTKSLLDVFDENSDNCITKKGIAGKDNPGDPVKDTTEWKRWDCFKNKNGAYEYDTYISLKRDEDGNLMIDLSQMLEDLGLDDDFYQSRIDNPDAPLPSGVSNLNDKLDSFTGSFDEVIDMMDALGVGSGSEEDSWKDDIEKYKNYAGFYKAGTRIDEDGDGCIEEDLLDGQDNDGDGLKNANARVASTDPSSPLWGKAGINHSMYGEVENSANINHSRNYPVQLSAPVYIKNKKDAICPSEDCTELWGDEDTGMVTVIGFTQESGYWTSNDLDLKLAVAQDTICGQLNYSLEERKTLIGGCWPNYDDEKFLRYWLRRGLASADERERRTHPSCKTCTSTADCLRKKGN